MNTRWDANDTGAKEDSTFIVQVDDLPAITVTTNSSGVFTNLSLAKEHLMKIRLDGKVLTSFRFDFKARGDHLRLWYNPFYGTWSLSYVREGEKCACPKEPPEHDAAANRRGRSPFLRELELDRAHCALPVLLRGFTELGL